MCLGFLFPGQGAQRVGMLADVSAAEPTVGRRLEAAGEVLGFDLARVVRAGPVEELNRTEVTQPALLTVSLALFELWRERGGMEPAVVAGHSLGEYSALTAAGVLPFEAAVSLVRERGKLMQRAVSLGAGAMTAVIGLADDAVNACCEATPGVVTPANYNAPGQVVIAGEAVAVAAAASACLEAGARRAVPLDVSVPSHCALMAPASERLAELLEAADFQPARVPVVQNVDAAATVDADEIRRKLLRQLVSPVRWAASVRAMAREGLREFVECGPGNVLTGLARRVDRSLNVRGIGDMNGLESALANFPADGARAGTETAPRSGGGSSSGAESESDS